LLIPFSELVRRHGVRIDRVIHAGAHLGEEASAYAASGVKDVLWIEGNPDLVDRLRANVADYGHTVVRALLGAESGREVGFNVSNFESMSSSVLELGTHREVHPEVEFVDRQTHRLQTLDEVAEEAGFIGADFLNLDLQGYELECLKGAERVLEHVRTVYSEVNVDRLYEQGALLPDLDAFLNRHGFEAREVKLNGSPVRDSPDWVGWGDCCFVREARPRPFAQVFPLAAGMWLAGHQEAPSRMAGVRDALPIHVRLDFGGTWRGRLALAITSTELARRLPTAVISETGAGVAVADLLVLDGDRQGDSRDGLAELSNGPRDATIGSVVWQGVHIRDEADGDPWRGDSKPAPAIVSVADAGTERRLRSLSPELGVLQLPDVGLLAARLYGPASNPPGAATPAESDSLRGALVDAEVRNQVGEALSSELGLTLAAIDSPEPDELLAAVEGADVVISADPRLLAAAFSIGRPIVALSSESNDRLRVTFGTGIATAMTVADLSQGLFSAYVDRTLLAALQAELDAYFDRVATLAAESAWRRRQGDQVAQAPGAARLTDAQARAFALELNAHGDMSRSAVEERHQVVARDRELAAQRDQSAELVAALQTQLESTRNELSGLRQTRTFRYTSRLRSAYVRALSAIGRR
jgi:FkbM family methyltransferase